MEIGLQELKEGLKEKGLTQSELDLLDHNVLDHYLDELKKEIQSELERNMEAIVEDIKEEHLVPTPWIAVIYDPNSHVGTGLEIDSILVEPGEDIIQEVHRMYDTTIPSGERLGNTGQIIIPMGLIYAEEFIHQFKGMMRKIRIRSEGVHNKYIPRVSIDDQVEDDEEGDEGDEE